MDIRSVPHPGADTLQAFGMGRLDDTAALAVVSHLESCPDCRREVMAQTGDDFFNRLRAAHGPSSTPAPAKAPSGAGGTDFESDLRSRSGQPSGLAATTPPVIANLPPELAGNSQYEIVRELGRGGMGVVYQAKNKLLARMEVLKVVNQALLTRPGALERFLREMQSAARLSHPNGHPNVVAAYSALQLGELLVFAMEYVEGEDLAQVVKDRMKDGRGPLPVVNACYCAQQAAQGLQHAHRQGMVHRDIKPANLILYREGKNRVVKVLDFGLAKATSEKGGDPELTGAGQCLGTPAYMAPEQWANASKADIRADIYSLGCTLYHLLTGGPPYASESAIELWQAHRAEEAPSLSVVRPEVPEELAAVVRKMMAKEPGQRYQTPAEVVQALAPFIQPGQKGTKPARDLSEGTSDANTGGPKVKNPDRPPDRRRDSQSVPRVAEEESPPEGEKLADGSTPGPRPTSKRKWAILAGVAACVLLLGLVGLWAGGVLKVNTKVGVIVLENLPDDAEVVVDDKRVTLKAEDGKAIEISVVTGKKHRLQIKKDGFKIFGQELEIEAGSRRPISVHLDPSPVAVAEPAPRKKFEGEVAEFEKFRQLVAGLTPQGQVKAVADRLKERNAGFDGKLGSKIEDGAVVELTFPTDAVIDISPLRALPKLQRLYLTTDSYKGKLADLTPLHGMPLTHLSIRGCSQVPDLTALEGMKLVWLDAAHCYQLRDLTPLYRMPLTWLSLWACHQVGDLTPLLGMKLTRLDLNDCRQVRDLTPVQGMKLTELYLNGSQVRDLTPLHGMPLTLLSLWDCGQVGDLRPLQAMPLTNLNLWNCGVVHDLAPLQGMRLTKLLLGRCSQVRDLSPLRGMPLTWLDLCGCGEVRDLTPLQGLPLEFLVFDPKNITKGIEGIRRMKSLQRIGDSQAEDRQFPAAEFWKRYDAGEFKELLRDQER